MNPNIFTNLVPTLFGAVRSIERIMPKADGHMKQSGAINIVKGFFKITDILSKEDEALILEWIELIVKTLNRAGEFKHSKGETSN